MRIRLFQFLLVLALLVSEAAGGIRLGRNRDQLTVPLHKEPLYYDMGGASVSIDGIKLHLYASLEPEDPWFWVTFDQDEAGLVEINFGPRWSETGAETHNFCSFAAALESEEFRELLCELFFAIDQGQVCCSSRFIRLRDGEEQPDLGDETVFACQHWFDLLDDPDFRVRDEATLALSKLGDDAAIWLMRQNRDDMSPETAMRMDMILSHYPIN